MTNKLKPIKFDDLKSLGIPHEELRGLQCYQFISFEEVDRIEVPAGALYFCSEPLIHANIISLNYEPNLKSALICSDVIICDSVHLRTNSYLFSARDIVIRDQVIVDDIACKIESLGAVNFSKAVLNTTRLPEFIENSPNLSGIDIQDPQGTAKEYLKKRQSHYERNSVKTVTIQRRSYVSRPGEEHLNPGSFGQLVVKEKDKTILVSNVLNNFSSDKKWLQENQVELKYTGTSRYKWNDWAYVVLDLKNETARFQNEKEWTPWSRLFENDKMTISF